MAIWRNTTVVGLLEVTEQYLISDHNYNLSKVSAYEKNPSVDTVEIGDDRTNTTIVGDNVYARSSNGHVILENQRANDTVTFNTDHLVLRGNNTFTWGESNPDLNTAVHGQLYFKIIK